MDWIFTLMAKSDVFRKNFKKDWGDDVFLDPHPTTYMFSSRNNYNFGSAKVIIVRTSRTAFTIYTYVFNRIGVDDPYGVNALVDRQVLHFKSIKAVAKYLDDFAQSL